MNSLLQLILTFVKIGTFSFGGGYAMIPFIREETVQIHHWISTSRLLDLIAISQSTPGPIAVNLATYIGYQQAGFVGSLAATIAVSLPSFFMAGFLWRLKNQGAGLPALEAIFAGIRPAAVGLIAGVCITMGFDAVKNPVQLLICLTVFAISMRTRVKTGFVLAASAAAGVLFTWSGLMGGLG